MVPAQMQLVVVLLLLEDVDEPAHPGVEHVRASCAAQADGV